MESKILKKLSSKLRQPIHITYIAKYILNVDEKECREKLEELVKKGYVEEHSKFEDYYSIK